MAASTSGCPWPRQDTAAPPDASMYCLPVSSVMRMPALLAATGYFLWIARCRPCVIGRVFSGALSEALVAVRGRRAQVGHHEGSRERSLGRIWSCTIGNVRFGVQFLTRPACRFVCFFGGVVNGGKR